MADRTVIQELVAILEVEVDQASLTKFDNALSSFRRLAFGLTAALGVANAAVIAWTRSAASAGDEAIKASRDVGTTVESLQELRYAADQSGFSAGNLQRALHRLNAASESAKGGVDDATGTFQRLGVSLEDLDTLEPDRLFERVIEGLRQIPSATERSSIAISLFGRTGRDMGTLMEEGAEGIAALRQEAVDLGLVFSRDAAQAAEDFSSAMGAVRSMVAGLKNQVGMALIPTVLEWTLALKELLTLNREIIGTRITAFMQGLTRALSIAGRAIGSVLSIVNRAADAFGGWGNVLQVVRFALVGLAGVQVIQGLRALVVMGNTLIAVYRAVGLAGLVAKAGMLAGPLAYAAALAVVIFAVEDFVAFLRGQDSIIGRWVAQFAESEGFAGVMARWLLDLQDVVQSWQANWTLMKDFFAETFGWIGAFAAETWADIKWVTGELVNDLANLWGGFMSVLAVMWGGIVAGFTSTFGVVKTVVQSVLSFMVDGIANVSDGLLAVVEAGASVLRINTDSITRAREGVRNMQASLNGSGGAVAPARGGGSSTVNAGGVTVQIQGSTNMSPEQVRRATQNGTTQGLQQILGQTSRAYAGSES